MEAEDLKFLRMKLKQSDYDWVDIMQAWIAIDELIKLREFRDKAFQAHPNDVEYNYRSVKLTITCPECTNKIDIMEQQIAQLNEDLEEYKNNCNKL